MEKTINMEITLLAGANTVFENISLAGQGQASTLQGKDVTHIGDPDPFPIVISPPSRAPEIKVPYLGIDAGDEAASVIVQVDRYGTVYCMAVPLVSHSSDKDGNPVGTDYVMHDTYPEVNAQRPALETIPTGQNKAGEVKTMTLDPTAPEPRRVINKMAQAVTTRFADSGNALLTTYGTTINITNLTANTVYLLYLVSADENGTPSSNAICYKFTTTPPEPPKITIVPSGSTRTNIQVDKPATLDYILVRNQQIQSDANPFMKPFTYNDTASGATNLADKELPANWSGTVLKAMRDPYYDGDTFMGSVFDVCASTAAKQEYAGYIREPNDVFVNPAPAMNVTTTVQSQTGQFNLTGMEGQNYYTLVVVARGQNSTSDGFRAMWSYYNIQNDFLYLLSGSVDPESQSLTPDVSYTGPLTLTFSGSLHFNVRDGNEEKPTPLDSCWLAHAMHTSSDNVSNGHVNIGSIMFPSSYTTFEMTNPTPETSGKAHGTTVGQVLEFEVKNARPGASITFTAGLCGANGAVRNNTSDASLQVILRKRTTGGQTEWYLEWNDAWNSSTE